MTPKFITLFFNSDQKTNTFWNLTPHRGEMHGFWLLLQQDGTGGNTDTRPVGERWHSASGERFVGRPFNGAPSLVVMKNCYDLRCFKTIVPNRFLPITSSDLKIFTTILMIPMEKTPGHGLQWVISWHRLASLNTLAEFQAAAVEKGARFDSERLGYTLGKLTAGT